MAFKASNVLPQDAYPIVKRGAWQMRINLAAFVTTLAAGPVNFDYIRDIYFTLKRANDQFNTLKITPGLPEYAQAQEGDPAYNVAAEFTTMQNAIASAMTWITSNAPTNVTALTADQWSASGTMIANTFTAAQTAGLRTVLQSVVDTIG